MKTSTHFQRGVWALVVGMAIAWSGVGAEALLRLAYAQNALDSPENAATAQLIFQLPAYLAINLGVCPEGLTDFGHDHSQGAGFWEALRSYLLINGIGWAAFLLVARELADLARRFFGPGHGR